MRRRLGNFRGLTREKLVSDIYKRWTASGYKNVTKKSIDQFGRDKLLSIWLHL